MSATHPLRDWRNKTGEFAHREGDVMRQEVLADILGVQSSTISQIETGTRRPSLTLAAKMSDLTGIPISEFAFFDRASNVEAAE